MCFYKFPSVVKDFLKKCVFGIYIERKDKVFLQYVSSSVTLNLYLVRMTLYTK